MSVEELHLEKLIIQGSQQLTKGELLALLNGSGNPGETAVQIMQRLMASLNHDLSALHTISLDALLQWKGIGPAKAAKIKAALELGKRIQGIPSQEKVSIPVVQLLMLYLLFCPNWIKRNFGFCY